MSFSAWGQARDPNAPFDLGIIIAGAILYIAALAFAIFYNFRATRSVLLALSTSMLQQLAVFIWLRLEGDRVSRRQ